LTDDEHSGQSITELKGREHWKKCIDLKETIEK